MYWHLVHDLDVAWLWDRIGALPGRDRWQASAKAAQRDEWTACLRELTARVMSAVAGDVGAWMARNAGPLARLSDVFAEIRTTAVYDLTTLPVALRQLRATAASAL